MFLIIRPLHILFDNVVIQVCIISFDIVIRLFRHLNTIKRHVRYLIQKGKGFN